MDLSTFITTVFCLIDDWLKEQRIRRRGPAPKLAGSEVLTIEAVGEFLGIESDKGLYDYFRCRYVRCHYAEWFPTLAKVHRTTFCRQAANLWIAKHRLWRHLLGRVCFDPALSLIHSSPVPVCRFARAYRCRRLAGASGFGYNEPRPPSSCVPHRLLVGVVLGVRALDYLTGCEL